MPPSTRPPLTAADIMTASPRTCSPYSTVLEAVLIFRDADCGAVPVLDDGKAIGILTDRDVALAIADHDPGVSSLPVSQIMKKDVITIRSDALLGEVMERFGDRQIRRLLVIDDKDQLLGIIAWADVAPHVPDQTLGQAVSDTVGSG